MLYEAITSLSEGQTIHVCKQSGGIALLFSLINLLLPVKEPESVLFSITAHTGNCVAIEVKVEITFYLF